MSTNTTGERLHRLRLGAGIGQLELAERASVAAGTISMVERGHAMLDLRSLAAVAEVLDVSPEYLWVAVRPSTWRPRHSCVRTRTLRRRSWTASAPTV